MKKSATKPGFATSRSLLFILLGIAGTSLAMVSFATPVLKSASAKARHLAPSSPTVGPSPTSGTLSVSNPTVTYSGSGRTRAERHWRGCGIQPAYLRDEWCRLQQLCAHARPIYLQRQRMAITRPTPTSSSSFPGRLRRTSTAPLSRTKMAPSSQSNTNGADPETISIPVSTTANLASKRPLHHRHNARDWHARHGLHRNSQSATAYEHTNPGKAPSALPDVCRAGQSVRGTFHRRGLEPERGQPTSRPLLATLRTVRPCSIQVASHFTLQT